LTFCIEESQANQLLCDRAASLNYPAGFHIGDKRTRDPYRINARVLIKALVLGRQDGRYDGCSQHLEFTI
jgi:hypothetical protein